MIGFKEKKILLDSSKVGERLRSARTEMNIDIKDVSKVLNINPEYLRALEEGRPHKLPAGIYRKNITTSYARFLGLEEAEITGLFAREDTEERAGGQQDVFSRKIPHTSFFLPVPKIIRSAILIIIVLVCVGYLGSCFKAIVSPPKLIVFTPKGGVITDRSNVEVRGVTEPEAEVVINGESVLTDPAGNFTKSINLKTGLNTILVSAQKKHSSKKSITKQVLVRGGG